MTTIDFRGPQGGQLMFPPTLFPPLPRHEDAPDPLRDRVFFALYPEQQCARAIARLAHDLRDRHGMKGWPLGVNRFHVTLLGLGELADLPDEALAAIIAATRTVATPPFRVGFNRAISFNGGEKPPLVLIGDDGVAGITRLHDELVTAMRRVGFVWRSEPDIRPHLTLLYDGHKIAGQNIDEIGWTAREFLLVHSPRGQSRHLELARFPLRA
jgi:2'-5' RNA ligase